MFIFRAVLIVIFGLLFVSVVAGISQSAGHNKETDLTILALFAVIIVVLGPLWPSKEKIENSKRTLPTDNPKLAMPLFMAGLAIVSFYFALNEWTSPTHSHSRLSTAVYFLFGSTGVMIFWVLLGFLCLFGGYTAYKKFRAAKPPIRRHTPPM